MSSRAALLAVAASLALVGCAGAGAAGPVALLAAVALVLAACSTPSPGGPAADAAADDGKDAVDAAGDAVADVGTDTATDTGKDTDADTVPDAVVDVAPDTADAGSWDPCCEDGKVTTCFCPANVPCNYAGFTDCGDGTCIAGDVGGCAKDVVDDVGPADVTDTADTADDAGTWSPCCTDGQVSTCYCPPNAICNFVPYTDCGGGLCATIGTQCPTEPDAGPTDTAEDAGTWDPCCQGGMITTCYCPPGVACNYAWFKDCGEGTCVAVPDECP